MVEISSHISDYLHVRRAHGPAWSPDGTHIAYISDSSGLDQVWLTRLADTQDTRSWQLTDFPDRVGLVSWSPDNQHLLASVDAGGNEHDQFYLISMQDGSALALTDQPQVIHQFGDWSPDGRSICYSSNERHPAFFDVWVLDIFTGHKRCIFQKDATLHPELWFPDNSALLVRQDTSELNHDLYLVPLADVQATMPILLTAASGEASYEHPSVTADGKTLYVSTNYQREFLAPARIDLSLPVVAGQHAPLSYLVDTHWDIEGGLPLSPDEQTLAWALNEDGYSRLIFFDLRTAQELPAPETPTGVIEGIIWSPQGDGVAFGHNGTRNNGNIWLARLGESVARQITEIPIHVDTASLVEPQLIHYPAFDGLSIPGYYYRPQRDQRANAEGKLPVIIFVHGGPESQFRPLYAAPWMPPLQYYLNQGFAVFAPNVRGSAGYGQTYIHLDDVRLRPNSVADLKSAVDWLIEHGNADPKRIGIMGRSYGGFMVLAALTTYPDLWAAGADMVGIANFLTFFERTGVWRRHLRAAEYGDPQRDAAFLREISPLFNADKITAPLLVLHGMNDPRVPVQEAQQIVAVLQDLNRPTDILLFPDEGHFMLRQSTQLRAYPAIADWFERYMG